MFFFLNFNPLSVAHLTKPELKINHHKIDIVDAFYGHSRVKHHVQKCHKGGKVVNFLPQL